MSTRRTPAAVAAALLLLAGCTTPPVTVHTSTATRPGPKPSPAAGTPATRTKASTADANAALAAAFARTPMAQCLRDRGFDHAPEAYDMRGQDDALFDGVVGVSDSDGNVVTASWDEHTGFALSGGDVDKETQAVAACRHRSGR